MLQGFVQFVQFVLLCILVDCVVCFSSLLFSASSLLGKLVPHWLKNKIE